MGVPSCKTTVRDGKVQMVTTGTPKTGSEGEEDFFPVTDDDHVCEIAHEHGLDGWAATIAVREDVTLIAA